MLGDELPFETVEASATFDRVLFDGGEFGTAAAPGSPEEEEFLGLPGLLEPDQVATLLRKRQSEQLAAKRARPKPRSPSPSGRRTRSCAALRKELNGLVGAWNHRTGQPHGVIHAELRRPAAGRPSPRPPPSRSGSGSRSSASGRPSGVPAERPSTRPLTIPLANV